MIHDLNIFSVLDVGDGFCCLDVISFWLLLILLKLVSVVRACLKILKLFIIFAFKSHEECNGYISKNSFRLSDDDSMHNLETSLLLETRLF